jgi:hypothetical protein
MDRLVQGHDRPLQKGRYPAMTLFIPEWTSVSAQARQVKRIFNEMDQDSVVRYALRAAGWTPSWFLDHPFRGWLSIMFDTTPFSELDPLQLFETEQRPAFERMLADFRDFASGIPCLPKMLLLWSCTERECRALREHYAAFEGILFISRDLLERERASLFHKVMRRLDRVREHQLLGEFFPETEIPAICTTKRDFHTDNSARLTRYFLDVDQEAASKLDVEFPAELEGAARDLSVRLINGVAGSGKTLVAVHRAVLLAERFPRQEILLLVHNTPIVADIRHRLFRSRGDIPRNLTISTFYAWAFDQWSKAFERRPLLVEKPNGARELVAALRRRFPPFGQKDEQLVDELEFINDFQIESEGDYLAANRAGRGFALRPSDRKQIFALYKAMLAHRAAGGPGLFSDLPREIRFSPNLQRLKKWHHVLVDEAQFFTPSWFELVKVSMQPGGQLFLCADPNQGFLKGRLSWKSVGLDVSGRTRKLRKSYRTTAAILSAARRVLECIDGGDPDDFLEPDYAEMNEGPPPLSIVVPARQDTVLRTVNEISALIESRRLPPSAFMVVYGKKISRDYLYEKLCERVGENEVWWFNHPDYKKVPPNGHDSGYLRMAYVETVTGMEAPIVFLVGIEDIFWELRDAAPRSPAMEEKARLLYMAMTRAGSRLALISSQRIPEPYDKIFPNSDVRHLF